VVEACAKLEQAATGYEDEIALAARPEPDPITKRLIAKAKTQWG
jgi:hypothetical protein